MITKNDEAHLSERAKRALKTMRYYGNAYEDQNLSVDLSNARKPDSGDRASAVWIIKYMQDNDFKSTLELKNAISDKWDAIFKAKQAAEKPVTPSEPSVDENFADGRHPEDRGDSKRLGVPTKSSVSNLRKYAKSHSGRAAQLAHWMANMKSGKKKAS